MGVDTVGDVTLKVDHSFESPQLVVENRYACMPVAVDTYFHYEDPAR